MTTSTMLLNNVTAIDLGFINPAGVTGHSCRLSFYVTGTLDADEQVVVDFSSVKKSIKSIIDDNEIGIDHKTVVLGYTSKIDNPDGTVSYSFEADQERMQITAPANALIDWIDRVDLTVARGSTLLKLAAIGQQEDLNIYYDAKDTLVAAYVQGLLDVELPKRHPNVTKVEVKVIPTQNYPMAPSQYMYSEEAEGVEVEQLFHYSHGLPRSTSWGCQNILHGHSSLISLKDHAGIMTEEQLEGIVDDMVAYMGGAYLVAERDLDGAPLLLDYQGEAIHISAPQHVQYESMSRGTFGLTLPTAQKIVIMATDTTVENIVQHLWDRYVVRAIKVVTDQGMTPDLELYVSEGLDKGAVVRQE